VKQLINYKNLIIFYFVVIFTNLSLAEISYVDTRASGSGETFEIALKKALTQAISKINGVSIETQSVLETIEKTVSTNEGNSGSLTRNLKETINEKTKGSIKTFEILNESKDLNGIIKVEVSATVAKFNLSQSAQRKRIAILPFRLNTNQINLAQSSPEDFRQLLNQKFSNYLVQTRKFTVLDREFENEIKGELANLTSSNNIEDQVKIGQSLFADYILVGRVDKLEIKDVEKKFLTSDKVIKKKIGVFNFSYRIIDVPTSQIKYSSDVNFDIDVGKSNQPLVDISQLSSQKAGVEIMYAIYPILVEKIEGELLYLGQGGNQIKLKDQYSLFERTEEKIKDSYTGETLGNVEKKIGLVEIVDSNSKFSVAKIIETEIDFKGQFEPRKYVLKPHKSAEDINQNQTKERINNEKKKINEIF